MKRYSIVHIPVLSFYSKELYKDVGSNWKGVAFGYLFLLLLVCSVLRMVAVQRRVSKFIDTQAPSLIEQVPRITISKGKASIEEPEPYYIRIPDNNDVLAVIDTTGEIKSLDDTGAFILLTRTEVSWRQSKVETRSFDLADVKNFVLDQDKINGWVNIFKRWFALVLLPFVLVGSYIFRIIQALIYGAIGLLFASWSRVRLSYGALLRLAVAAVTPCIIVRTILELASVRVPWAGFWFFLLAMGYLYFGVRANAESEQSWPLQADASSESRERLE